MNTPTFNKETLEEIENLEAKIKLAETAADVYYVLDRFAKAIPNNYELGYYLRGAVEYWLKKKIMRIEYDKCVLCGKDTPYTYDVHIDYRYGYVEGAGQLCRECYDKN